MSSLHGAHSEVERLKTLYRLGLLDTAPEPEFDDVVHLAAAICDTPISLVTLVDERRQWFKASFGLAVRETPRDIAFCSRAIQQAALFVVEDARLDPRFADNPLVTGHPDIRFYAGMPLETPNGHRMGTLCVIDRVPRQLTDSQIRALKVLAQQVRARMELKLQRTELEAALADRERFAEDLATSERLFRSFMDHSPFISYMKDEQGRFVYYNKRMEERYAIDQESWIDRRAEEVFPPEAMQEFRRNELEVMRRNEALEFIERTTEDGRSSVWRSYKFPCVEPAGRRLLAGISVDVTHEVEREAAIARYQAELELANRKLQELAVTDALTGLGNRRALDARLAVEFPMAVRKGRPLSVALLDIDDFKRVNDEQGHPAGDVVLRDLGHKLGSTIRASDMAGRYGGEEFLVILTETLGEDALSWARRLQQALAETPWSAERVTVSIGIAAILAEGDSQTQMIERADEALYAAKRAGKDCAVVWSPELAKQA